MGSEEVLVGAKEVTVWDCTAGDMDLSAVSLPVDSRKPSVTSRDESTRVANHLLGSKCRGEGEAMQIDYIY